jgi:hypothetical protein
MHPPVSKFTIARKTANLTHSGLRRWLKHSVAEDAQFPFVSRAIQNLSLAADARPMHREIITHFPASPSFRSVAGSATQAAPPQRIRS